MTAKVPLKVHLRLRFQNLGKPRTAGLCGRPRALATAALYLVLKSNGLRHSKNPPVKFSFSLKIVPATIAKKLPLQRRPKPLFIAFFSLSHKRPTFAFTGESGYTLGFRRKDRTQRLTRRNRGFPSLDHSAALCRQRNTLYSATLLYTYISRFSVNPQHQQKRKIWQSCCHKFSPPPFFSPLFNFSHKWPTFAFTGESGYTLGFPRKIAHSGLHAETGGRFGRGGITTLGAFRTFHQHPRAGYQNGKLCRFWVLVGCTPEERERAFGTAMRLCASLSRGVAAPGLRDLFATW